MYIPIGNRKWNWNQVCLKTAYFVDCLGFPLLQLPMSYLLKSSTVLFKSFFQRRISPVESSCSSHTMLWQDSILFRVSNALSLCVIIAPRPKMLICMCHEYAGLALQIGWSKISATLPRSLQHQCIRVATLISRFTATSCQ